MSSNSSTDSYIIRQYKQSDLPELEELETVTFLDNPLMNYMGGVQKPLTNDPSDGGRQALKGFQSFMTQNVIMNGGHIDVIVDPQPADGSGKEKVIATALWFAPGKQLSPTQVFTMLKSGLVSVLRKWGFGALPKIPEFSDQAAKVAKDGFSRKGIETSPKQAWYLQIISVHPDYQSKGSSRIIRSHSSAMMLNLCCVSCCRIKLPHDQALLH
jgi:hypothetical protein